MLEPYEVRGRFAPSPSGRMHLGNLWSCLLAWLAARSAGGSIVLRLEDLDPDRCRQEYCDQVMRDLEWLGWTGMGSRSISPGGQRPTPPPSGSWRGRGWSIPATVHVQSVWLPLPPTARTE